MPRMSKKRRLEWSWFNEWGYVDGQGEQARFDTPVQGTFVKNEDYVREGKDCLLYTSRCV